MTNLQHQIFSSIQNRFINAMRLHLKSKRKWHIHSPHGSVDSCDLFSTKNVDALLISPVRAQVNPSDSSHYLVEAIFFGQIKSFFDSHLISESFNFLFYGGGLSEECLGHSFSSKADLCDVRIVRDSRFDALSDEALLTLLALLA